MSATTPFKPGDIVRVKSPEHFITAFANKIRDRDAEVIWVGPTAQNMHHGKVKVQFKKRNGRGTEFTEILRISDFVAQAKE